MAIEIKEYFGATFKEIKDQQSFNPNMNLTEAAHYSNRVASNSLMVDIEGLHSVVTRNDTLYTDKAMQDAAPLWTAPYERPVIMHHNESDGITIGRIKHAYWTDKNTRSGTGATRFITNIGTKEGIEGVENGTLSTVSVGLIAHEVRCSICNQDLASEGECEHEKGAYYDGKKCVWIIHKFEPKELSFVIVPSDPYAHILKVYKPDSSVTKQIRENLNNKEVNNMYGTWDELLADNNMDLTEASKKEEDVKETAQSTGEATEEKQEAKNVEEQEDKAATKEESSEQQKEEEKTEEEVETKTDATETVEEEETAETKEETEGESKSEEEDTKEIETEETSKNPKTIEEDHQKDIDNKKDDIYKNIEKILSAKEEENTKLKAELEELKKDLSAMKNKLQVETSLKESAEQELMTYKIAKKKSLVEELNTLRKQLNLEPESEKTLMESSEESLQFSIKNFKEFNSVANTLNIPKVQSTVAVVESRDNTQKTKKEKSLDVKESNHHSNINLEGPDALVHIFSEAMNGHKGY